MLTQEQIQEIGRKAGITTATPQSGAAADVARRRQLAAEYDAKQKRTFMGDLKAIGERRGKQFEAAADATDQNILSRGFQGAGAVLGGAADVMRAGASATFRALPEEAEQPIREQGTKILQSAMNVPMVGGMTLGQSILNIKGDLERLKEERPEMGANLEALLSIADFATSALGVEQGTNIAGKTASKVAQGAKSAVATGSEIAEQGAQVTKRATEQIVKKLGPPEPTPLQAAGQVLQGKTSELKEGVRGLAALETEGVKTFQELGTKIKSKIGELAKQVDADLGLDETKHLLNDLVVTAKTTGGKIIKSKPVTDALNQLQELYIKIGDKVEAANIKELIAVAKKQGLTRLEVNDIARVYGQEFGQKAFNKMGDALTSVNAQLYENTRKALKDVARAGIKGEAAKLADQTMSSLYDTERLIKKNIEAVNKLAQKINERGLLEKFGHAISKYGDILTGGTIRGFVGGLLPRGAGYKVMNAMDIEKALEKNLRILQDAIKSGSDAEILKILQNVPKGSRLPGGVKGQVFERAEKLSEADRTVESLAFEKIAREEETLLQSYKAKHGKIVNADEFRPMFIEEGYAGHNAAAVQEPVSYLSKKAFSEGLKEEGKYALFTSGMSGAGKTSALKNVPIFEKFSKKASVILDSNLSNKKSAIAKMNEVKKAGKIPVVFYTYRELLDGLVEGVVKRMLKNTAEMGRIVPTKIIAQNAPGSWEVATELSKDGYKVFFVDNSLGFKKAKLSSFNEIKKKINYPKDVKPLLDKKMKELYESGTITEGQYKRYIE